MSTRRPNGGGAVSSSSKSPAATVVKGGRDALATTTKSDRNSGVTSAKSDRNSGVTSAKSGGAAAAGVTMAAAVPPAAAAEPVKYGARPSRGFSAMTDDRGTAATDAARCGPPCCVPNGCTKPEGHYACDRQAAKVLAQYVTPDERGKVLRWLDALQRLNGAAAAAVGEDAADEDEQSERSMYMTCLLMLLRSGRLVAPFTRSPPEPPRPLKPLRDAVDRRLYKRVQIECRRRRLHERARYERPDDVAADRPSGFFDRMPEPCDGVFCYGAVFSDILS